MRKDIFDGFYKPLDVKVRIGRGADYSYVTADDVTNRMNNLFKGNWSSALEYQDIVNNEVIVRVRVHVEDPETKRTFFHEGYGGHKNDGGEPGSAFKSAYSKALANACRRWGVGLYLEGQSEEATIETKPQTAPVNNTPPTITNAPPKEIASMVAPPAVQKSGPPIPTQPDVQAVSNTPPVVSDIKVQQIPVEQPEPRNEIPKIPKPMSHGAPLPSSKPMVANLPPLTKDENPIAGISEPNKGLEVVENSDGISDVQRIAIQSFYDMRGFKYEDLATGALDRVPDINTLTHDEAVSVIQYGNGLYKKQKQNR